MEYKVIKNYKLTYLPNNIFEGQEKIPLLEVKGGIDLELKIGDIVEFSNDKNDKFVKLNSKLIDRNEFTSEFQNPEYYVNNGYMEIIV